jgi:hypothetical protein
LHVGLVSRLSQKKLEAHAKTVIAAANALSYELAGSVTGRRRGVVATENGSLYCCAQCEIAMSTTHIFKARLRDESSRECLYPHASNLR